ncbi:hypothetical protein PIB30_093644 [Stylosanthes scabra]|uniref:Uncharacterized protein n=1 Tax=Stylosanthes scabra TaxID=79078 RepID=A0ABU6SWJ1_9FABA|nr:hypothetical protein [Stylosanthes scabra]
MSRRGQSSETRSRTLGDYIVGRDSRTCTISSDSVGQPKKKKFASPKCHCRSYAIIFQSCTKLNPDRFFLGNDIFMARRLKEFEQKVMELDVELKIKVKNDIRGVQDNKCLCFAISCQTFLGGLKPGVGINMKACGSLGLTLVVVGGLTIGCFMRNLAGGGLAGRVEDDSGAGAGAACSSSVGAD